MEDTSFGPASTEDAAGRQQPVEPDSLLTVRETASFLRVSRKRVYQLIDEKRLRAARLSERGTRVFRSSLVDYVESKRQG